jgi:hypothetical protein
MLYGPASVWAVFAVIQYAPRIGYARTAVLAFMVGFGILGLTAVFIAYFPSTVERVGWRRFGVWLRTFWDEDAK